eukprot:6200128-Pleurochrysis_carterae.AAC.1
MWIPFARKVKKVIAHQLLVENDVKRRDVQAGGKNRGARLVLELLAVCLLLVLNFAIIIAARCAVVRNGFRWRGWCRRQARAISFLAKVVLLLRIRGEARWHLSRRICTAAVDRKLDAAAFARQFDAAVGRQLLDAAAIARQLDAVAVGRQLDAAA